MFKKYYALTKPGIIYGNVLTTTAGFLLAAALADEYSLGVLLAVLAGTALVIASGCVFNNYIDRGIDAKMLRTQKRALVTHAVSGRQALLYASALGVLGFGILASLTNLTTVIIGLIGFLDYVVLYSYFKRHSVYGTLVGSISGATPIVAGYTAVAGTFDEAALALFLMMAVWQMPHFYAIAIYRGGDYAAAGLPVLPVKQGATVATRHIVAYMAAFLVTVPLLSVLSYTGYIYAIVMVGVALWWLRLGLQGFRAKDSKKWARKVFFKSLLVLLALSVMVSVGAILP
jgi:protoheme IX farnesyltransferase